MPVIYVTVTSHLVLPSAFTGTVLTQLSLLSSSIFTPFSILSFSIITILIWCSALHSQVI